MSERPDRPEEPSDYRWLYGQPEQGAEATRPVQRPATPATPGTPSAPPQAPPPTSRPTSPPPSAGPDSTRVIPTQPRPARATPANSTAYPAAPKIAPEPGRGGPGGPAAPTGPGGSGGNGGNGRRPWSTRTKVRAGILGVVVLALIWVGLEAWAGVSSWDSVHKVAWQPRGARPADQPGTTYLLVGSDSRRGLTAAQRKEYATGNDSGSRTDTIMLVHTGGGKSLVMSIPRDSLVAIPGHGTSKINAAFAWGGARLLVKTIEQDTGIHIDGYVEIGMGGVATMVDAVGGIQICPKTNMDDPLAGLHIKKGCQQVDGQVALAYSRSRHALATGDLGREADQREVISAVMHKIKSPSVIANPFKLHSVGSAVGTSISVGRGMSIFSAYKLYGALKALSSGTAKSCGTPIADWAVHWDPVRAKQMFGYIIADKVGDIPAKLCTPTGLAG